MSPSPNTMRIEVPRDFASRPEISHAIFDFDGTVSWLRHGWPAIMADLYREHLPPREDETEASLNAFVMGEILSLNGKPTIHQAIRLAELAVDRGRETPEPEVLRCEYQRRLDERIEERSAKIRSGDVDRDAYAVLGIRSFLDRLRGRGLRLYVLSGTVEHRVREEAELLGLAGYFDGGINGSPSDGDTPFTKMEVMQRILLEESIAGDRLVSFGDGRIELANAKELGGLAVAVASNEDDNGCGEMDPWKRGQLLDAGADLAVADYRDADGLMKRIFGS